MLKNWLLFIILINIFNSLNLTIAKLYETVRNKTYDRIYDEYSQLLTIKKLKCKFLLKNKNRKCTFKDIKILNIVTY